MGWLHVLFALVCDVPGDSIDVPKANDDRLVVELVASEPEIVTPTGLAVDERGRIWAIENQTHHRPADYKGPSGDRIRIYEDFGPDGRARQVRTFAGEFRDGMGLSFARNGDLYLATRSQIIVLRDSDQDDVADQTQTIVKLETAGDYPHNGLSGFAFDAFENVYFGCGENLGAPYKLIGSEGTTLSGGGEGGNIYRCRPDGSGLVRVATGFWNPFHLTFDAYGRLFAVDNDPDSRPPCRLLHIVQGGDYGYRYRNGRKGLHPFTAWNGELPGTLPMVAGTGEAPSGVVAYESDGLPREYRGNLFVTSWGDHVVQRFTLADRGASFSSQGDTFVRGDDNFYPVAIATAPDGSMVVTDWADKSYPLHGKGRIWRIRMKDSSGGDAGISPSAVRKLTDLSRLFKLLGHPKQEIRHAAGYAIANLGNHSSNSRSTLQASLEKQIACAEPDVDSRAAIHALWSAARSTLSDFSLKGALSSRCPQVRAEAVRIAAELIQTPSGANELQQYLRQSLSDETDSLAQVRLQVILAANSREAYDRVLPFLASEDPFLRGAAIECMSHSGRLESLMALSNFEAPAMRVGALLALRRTGKREATQSLRGFLNDADPAVRRAAIQWVAEEHLSEFEPALEDAVDRRPISRQVFEAYVAAKEILAGVTRTPSDEPSGEEFVAKILLDESQSASLRALALRSLRPDHPALQTSQLERWISTGDAGVRNEAVRTLAARPDPASQRLLRDVAANNGTDADIRAQAIAGLGHAGAITDDSVHVLLDLLRSSNPRLRREALRSLRAAASRPDVAEAVRNQLIKQDGFSFAGEREIAESLLRPTKEAVAIDKEWFAAFERSVVEGMSGDPVEGEIIFFHPSGPKCFACHRVNGRGGAVGPDLSAVGSMLDRAKIVRSILDPSKDIAPQFTSWRFALRDGRVMSGILLLDDPRGVITIGDADGKTIEILAADITERKAMDRSIMPDNLAIGLTRGELRDLVSYLMQLR